ncbi:MAG: ATP-binding protein [Chitinispirillaceae bacterium]|nr:ATP-binding protein [Chitinispirillaceae bacterium]
MIKREISKELTDAAREYPVVTVFGPRQSGKTTLARMTFPRKQYRSLEDPDVRRAAELDPREFLDGMPDGGILDEIQRAPHLLSYIQGIVDKKNKPGMFVLTGSHQTKLHEAVSQSLAGRTALLTLLPFSFCELKRYRRRWDPFSLAVAGCFPRLHDKMLKANRFFNGYVQTYVERDVRSLINLKDLGRFQQFLTLMAGRTGQVMNHTSIGNDIGISSTTVKSWIDVLKASYLVFELRPYYQNIRKQAVKSSKFFFTDTGLAAFLLGIADGRQLARDPLRGGLYENLVILEFLKACHNRGLRPDLYFYRDNHGNEVDLILKKGGKLVPVEIKSASTFNQSFLQGIERFRAAAGKDRVTGGMVLYNGDLATSVRGTRVSNPFLHDTAASLL